MHECQSKPLCGKTYVAAHMSVLESIILKALVGEQSAIMSTFMTPAGLSSDRCGHIVGVGASPPGPPPSLHKRCQRETCQVSANPTISRQEASSDTSFR